jgi:hypothetical protein
MKYWMEHAIFEIVGAIGTPLVIDVVGYLYVDLIFAKTNIQTRCWTQCFNRWLRLQCAMISCLDSAYLEIYFKREDS